MGANGRCGCGKQLPDSFQGYRSPCGHHIHGLESSGKYKCDFVGGDFGFSLFTKEQWNNAQARPLHKKEFAGNRSFHWRCAACRRQNAIELR